MKHFVSYSKIPLYQKKHACKINDYKALWQTMQVCATGTTPAAAIRINVNWEIGSSANSGQC